MTAVRMIVLMMSLAHSHLATAAPEDDLRNLSVAVIDALDRRDLSRLDQLLDPTFILVQDRGQTSTREAFLSDVRGSPPSAVSAERRRDWTNVRVFATGTTGTFVGRVTWRLTNDAAPERASFSTLVTQHWQLHEGGWKLTLLQRTRLPPPPEVHTFASDGLQLKAMVFKPVGPGPFPVIVYAHGNEPDPSDLFESVAPGLVARGYVVYGPHRRGSGLSADQAPNLLRTLTAIEAKDGIGARSKAAIQHLEGPHLNDMAAAVAAAKKLPYVDPQRVFLMGNSFGGVLALLAAERDIGVKAVADFAGSALNWERSELFRQRMSEAARNAKVPVFLAQAANDFSTGPTRDLGKVMQAAGKPHRAIVYPAFGITPGEGHVFGIDAVDQWAADVLPFLESAAKSHE